jgi:tRNA pseudouridine55 synthase
VHDAVTGSVDSRKRMKAQLATAAAALSGIFAVYKPRGVGSTDVVTRIRHCVENHLLSQTHVGSLSQSSRKALLRRKGNKPLVKVGHGGTLDPLAEGVLVVALGDSCSQLSNFLSGGKSYVAVGRLGARTDTCDVTGVVVETAAFDHVTLQALRKRLPDFRGEVQQVPPLFSALKKDGKRLYDHARDGTAAAADLQARPVFVYDIDVVAAEDVPAYVVQAVQLPPAAPTKKKADDAAGPASFRPLSSPYSPVVKEASGSITLEQAMAFGMTARFLPRTSATVPPPPEEGGEQREQRLRLPFFGLLAVVGGGTYVRKLVEDLAASAGTVGTMTDLLRTRQGPFTLAHCLPLDDACADLERIQRHLRQHAHVLGTPTTTTTTKTTVTTTPRHAAAAAQQMQPKRSQSRSQSTTKTETTKPTPPPTTTATTYATTTTTTTTTTTAAKAKAKATATSPVTPAR